MAVCGKAVYVQEREPRFMGNCDRPADHDGECMDGEVEARVIPSPRFVVIEHSKPLEEQFGRIWP